MYTPTAKGYFSGAGLMDIGFMQAGVQVVQSMDLDPIATECMRTNPGYFSHNVLTRDIMDMKVLDQPKTDIIIGTYPCTRYSTIADIHGTRIGDDLFLHFFRHIAFERPDMYVVENVPGMKKFPIVMEATRCHCSMLCCTLCEGPGNKTCERQENKIRRKAFHRSGVGETARGSGRLQI